MSKADAALRAMFLWRRLDADGHDCCRLYEEPTGWRLAGTAVFMEARRICELEYEVRADGMFRTTRAAVTGFMGKKRVDLSIRAASPGRWRVTGVWQPQLTGCLDVDLAFTPATNLLPLRRLALKIGQHADAPAAYLAFPAMRFIVLPQRYTRVSSITR